MNEKQLSKIKPEHRRAFAEVCQHSEDGYEFWSARDLQTILGYAEWRNFADVVEKAKVACLESGQTTGNHFVETNKMVSLGSGARRKVKDYHLSRYACYLIVQNGDPSKPVIASGQTYFAIQTRRQELADDESFQQLDEDKKRLFLRNELKQHNKQLVETASHAGVKSSLDFAIFQNHGYQGLYGGLAAKDIHKRKGLKKSQHILDHMGSTELAANLFRATQTEEKLRRENIKGKIRANTTHQEVGAKVRKTISELGGEMPEDLPTPETSARVLENKSKKQLEEK